MVWNKKGAMTRKHSILLKRDWRTLGVAGTHRGAGVTHLAVWLANWLTGVCHERTAVLEWNCHGDFARMARACRAKGEPGGAWKLLGTDYYAEAKAEVLAACIRSGYKRILIDYGEVTKEGIQEWVRCDKKIIVAALSEWQMEHFFDITARLQVQEADWKYAAVFGSEEMRMSIVNEMRIPIFRIPFSCDAFNITRKDMDFLQTLLGQW